jgi:hypothetical protein
MGPSKYFILFHSIFNLFNFWVDYMIITWKSIWTMSIIDWNLFIFRIWPWGLLRQ